MSSYMVISMRFIWSNHLGMLLRGENIVCKLKKTIYGLKESSRAWFEKISCVVSACDFQPCQSDQSVFIHHGSPGFTVLAVYVDDILLTGSGTSGIQKARKLLNAYFITKDMRRPRYFLGIEILS